MQPGCIGPRHSVRSGHGASIGRDGEYGPRSTVTDHLTPLDASFLELEEADASSHMHVGWTMVFDPLPGGGSPSLDQFGAPRARLSHLPRFRPPPLRAARGRAQLARLGRGRLLRHREPRAPGGLPSPAAMPSCSTGSATSTRTGSTARTRCGRSCCSRGSRRAAGRSPCKIHHCLVDGISGVLVTG